MNQRQVPVSVQSQGRPLTLLPETQYEHGTIKGKTMNFGKLRGEICSPVKFKEQLPEGLKLPRAITLYTIPVFKGKTVIEHARNHVYRVSGAVTTEYCVYLDLKALDPSAPLQTIAHVPYACLEKVE